MLASCVAIAGLGSGCHKPSASRGEVLFAKHCARCHIRNEGQASPAPMLSGYFYRRPMPRERDAEKVIREGRRAMPPFGARLARAEVDDLIAYLKTLR
jgi:mono/diheme cytochrome c family protein